MDLIQNVNWLDVVIFVILIMSIWVGFARGFLHELMTSMYWVLAFLGVYYLGASLIETFMPHMLPYLEPLPLLTEEQKKMAFAVVFYVAFFLFLLLLGQLIFGLLIKPIHNKIIGSVDHILGAVIGLIKGLIILSLIWMPLRALNLEPLVNFQRTSFLIPVIDICADFLAPLWDILAQKISYLLAHM